MLLGPLVSQNIPVTAFTEHVRDPEFVRQEWDQVNFLFVFMKVFHSSLEESPNKR